MIFRVWPCALLFSCFVTNSWGADPPSNPSQTEAPQQPDGAAQATKSTDTAAPTETEAGTPPSAERIEIDWKGPLQLYDLGQVNEALERLRAQVIECGEPEDGKCNRAQLATLYASTAIVLAGSGDHPGGVRAFRRALTYSGVRLLPAYKTPEVERALAEARGESAPAPAPAPAPAVQSPPAAGSTSYPQYAEKPYVSPAFRQGKALFMLSGIGQGGFISDGIFTAGVLRAAGAVNVASRTGDGMFAMGLRGTGGGLIGNVGALGTVGGSVLFGGMGLPRAHNRFGFVLGGIGIETFPAVKTSFVALDFLIGRALGGGVVAFSAHSGFNANEYFSTAGIEVGFGGLSKGN